LFEILNHGCSIIFTELGYIVPAQRVHFGVTRSNPATDDLITTK
jgi:hypothetical protein